MLFLIKTVRFLAWTIVGWFVGLLLSRVMFALEHRRIDRRSKKRKLKMKKSMLVIPHN